MIRAAPAGLGPERRRTCSAPGPVVDGRTHVSVRPRQAVPSRRNRKRTPPLELLLQDRASSGNEKFTLACPPVHCHSLDCVRKLVKTIAEVVDVLRLVPATKRVGFHDEEIRQRRHSEVNGVGRARNHRTGEVDADRTCEGCGERRESQDPKPFHQLRVVLPHLHIIRGEELHFHPHRLFGVSEVDGSHQLEVLGSLPIPAGIEEQFDQLGVPSVRQLRRRLPTSWPRRITSRAVSPWRSTFRPIMKNVTLTWCRSSRSSIRGVSSGCGPSSRNERHELLGRLDAGDEVAEGLERGGGRDRPEAEKGQRGDHQGRDGPPGERPQRRTPAPFWIRSAMRPRLAD